MAETQKSLHQRLYDELAAGMDFDPKSFEDKLKAALASGFPIDYIDGADGTLLCRSVYLSYNEIADVLLDYGADPNVADKIGSSPLLIAAENQRPIGLVDRLIRAGADVNAQNDWRSTAFYWAAYQYIYALIKEDGVYGLDAAKLLLDAGADPYLCDRWTEPIDGETKKDGRRMEQFKEWTDGYIRQREAAELAAKEDDESFMR